MVKFKVEALMKLSKKLTPAVIVLAMGVVGVLGYFSSQRAATAETPPTATRAEGHADATGAVAVCEDREVEVDEGYALSRKEVRHICH
jgi:hypothetical protein